MKIKRPKMGNKGIISVIELVIAAIILFVTFSIFFPGFTYTSKWDRALLVSRARDSFITLDSMGNLSDYSFNQNATYDFLNDTFYDSNLIFWSQTENAIKNSITVACHCDPAETEAINSWTHGVMVNDRRVDFIIINFSLGTGPVIPSDVLIIMEEEDLTPYRTSLMNYLREGNGIVEVRDFDLAGDVNPVQEDIFGIMDVGSGSGDTDLIVKPGSASELMYQSYKYFYSVPLIINATAPVEKFECSDSNSTGTMTIREQDYDFWICNSSRIYIDRDQNPNTAPSGPYLPTDKFLLGAYEFEVEFVRGNITGISFENTLGEYEYVEFLKESGYRNVKPTNTNGEYERGLLCLNAITEKACGYIVNDTDNGKTVYIADFARTGFDDVGDDHRHLLVTSLLWAANKEEIDTLYGDIQIGYKTSFVDIIEKDLLEIYKLNFGLGFPY